jgi:hypothetical protein
LLLERGERVGKKLSATGNGQGNISNLRCKETGYFSHTQKGVALAQKLITRFDNEKITQAFENMGVFLFSDERGRTYPTGKQASALTDALRFTAEVNGVELRVGTKITGIEKSNGGFILTAEKGEETQKIFAKVFEGMMTDGLLKKDNPEMLSFIYTAPVTSLVHLCDREPQKQELIFKQIEDFINHFISTYAEK